MTPEQFAVNVSIELLAMVIVGGLASIIGSWFGAAFILLLPGQIHTLIAWLAKLLGADIGIETLAHLPLCGVRRADHHLPAGRADGAGQALRQRAQLPAGLAVRLREEVR